MASPGIAPISCHRRPSSTDDVQIQQAHQHLQVAAGLATCFASGDRHRTRVDAANDRYAPWQATVPVVAIWFGCHTPDSIPARVLVPEKYVMYLGLEGVLRYLRIRAKVCAIWAFGLILGTYTILESQYNTVSVPGPLY